MSPSGARLFVGVEHCADRRKGVPIEARSCKLVLPPPLKCSVVAFLRKLPELSADQYQTMVKNAPQTHEEMMRGMEMDGDKGESDH